MSRSTVWRDDVLEARRSLMARIERTVSTSIAFCLGTAAAVGFFLIATTAQNQISSRFDALRATAVIVRTNDAISQNGVVFPTNFATLVHPIRNVSQAGYVVAYGDRQVRSSALDTATIHRVSTVGVSSGLLGAVGCRVEGGSLTFAVATDHAPETASHSASEKATSDQTANAEPVVRTVLLGRNVAAKLQVTAGRTVTFDGVPFTVVGILGACRGAPDLLGSAVMNDEVAASSFRGQIDLSASYGLLRIRAGAGAQVARQAPLALDPAHPDRFVADAPPDPAAFRDRIESDTSATVLSTAAVACLIGVLSMSNAAAARVREQRSDIGLRRALGASVGRVVRQTIAESVVVGVGAALFGAWLGLVGAALFALSHHWQLIVDWMWLPLVPAWGAIVGAGVGAVAARASARIEPSEALRSP